MSFLDGSKKYIEVKNEKIAELHHGKSLLGKNFFANDIGTADLAASANLKALLDSNPPDAGMPAMYCIAVDQTVIGFETTADAPDPNQNLYDTIWADNSITVTNRASIGAIIAWKSGRVSHYFPGDLYAPLEGLVTDWIGKTLDTKRILSMKASHHGSASSNPPKLLLKFRPKNIVVSAANMFWHPGM